MKMYSIYDKVAEQYGPIYMAINDGVAMRNYRKSLQELTPELYGDYKLVCVGEMDEKTGEIQPGLFEVEVETANVGIPMRMENNA